MEYRHKFYVKRITLGNAQSSSGSYHNYDRLLYKRKIAVRSKGTAIH